MSILLASDPVQIITALGYVGIFFIIFAESGLFFGFFFPGDSLLFTAGLLASQHVIELPVLLVLIPIAAILGDTTGYWFGSFIGPRIFVKENSLLFNKKYAMRAESFYEKYGPRAIILARFVPAIRTFVPIIAGVGRMRYATFLIYNITGGLLWGVGVTLLGFFLGKIFPNAEQYLLPMVLVIMFVSFLPLVFEWLKYKREN